MPCKMMGNHYTLGLLGILCWIGVDFAIATETHLFKTLTTTKLGQINISHSFNNPNGLSAADKQAVLDMHNALRAELAAGKITWSAQGTAPKATNMLAVEWDDVLAEFAQNHADTCATGHSDLNITHSNYTKASIAENMSGGVTAVDRDMFGEIRDFSYSSQTCTAGQQCGHYITVAAWAHFRMGCGFKMCNSTNSKGVVEHKISMTCVFAPYNSGGLHVNAGETRYRHQYEYWSGGEPCSECPQGWDYCMNDALCATKAQCDSDSNNNCACKNDQSTCESNGGTFDSANCRCTCPESKYGINCAHDCADLANEDSCGQTCGGGMLELFVCYKACGSCGKAYGRAYEYWMMERQTRNQHGLKVRVKPPVPSVSTPVQMSSLPGRGNCQNKESNYICEMVRRGSYCGDVLDIAKWEHYCSASCNTCGSTKFQQLLNKASSPAPAQTSAPTDSGWGPTPAGGGGGGGGWRRRR